MNTDLETQPIKQPKHHYLVILLIAIGLHLLVFSPLMAPYLTIPIFENVHQYEPLKPPLSIRLIYKKEPLATPQKHTQDPVLKKDFPNTLNLNSPGIPYKQGFDMTNVPAPFSSINDLRKVNPSGNNAARYLESKEVSRNFSLDSILGPDTETFWEQVGINEGAQKTKTEEENASVKASTLSQSLENTQIDSFSEGLESTSSANKETLAHIFSSKTKKQLTQAEEAQTQYEAAQTEEISYAITEDSDGTRYVNIKGICWRIPPPGTEEAWTIVYAGCSGQTKTFNIEINIGMDILGPDSPLAID